MNEIVFIVTLAGSFAGYAIAIAMHEYQRYRKLDKKAMKEEKKRMKEIKKRIAEDKKHVPSVEFLRSKGYPLTIRGNDGYKATLVNIQPLTGGEYAGIYRYPRGECVHSLEEIRTCSAFKVLQQ